MNAVPNPWEQAMNPPTPTQMYWGKIEIDARLVCLVKGVGKVDYTPGTVMPDGSEPRPVTAIKIQMYPLVEHNLQFDLWPLDVVANGNNEWGKVILPSLRAMGITDLKDVNGKFACVELVPTGEKYTSKKDGLEKEKTTYKFLKLFADQAACQADFHQVNGGASAPAAPAAAAPTNGGNGNKEKETAEKFLKVFVENAMRSAGGDLDKASKDLSEKLAAQPLVSKYFTADSPEVINLMMAAATA